MRTVKEISDLTGISVRTLHYYDEIGLLKPTEKSDAGYRLYDDKALETLQQVLFFREFDIPLKEIKAVMDNPVLERNQLLQMQRKMLVAKKERMERLITSIDDILKGENKMDFAIFSKTEVKEMFQTMLEHMPDNMKELAVKEFGSVEEWKKHYIEAVSSEEMQKGYAKVVEWYGGKEEYLSVVNNPISKDVADSYNKRIEAVLQKLIAKRNCDVNSSEVQEVVEEYGLLMKQFSQIKEMSEMSVIDNIRLTFLYIEFYSMGKTWVYPESYIPYNIFRYIVKGKAEFCIDGEEIIVKENQIVYIPQGCRMSCRALSESFEFYSLRFTTSVFYEGEDVLKEYYGIPRIIENEGEDYYFKEICKWVKKDSWVKKCFVRGYLDLLIGTLSMRVNKFDKNTGKVTEKNENPVLKIAKRKEQIDSRVQLVADYVVLHPREKYTPQKMAEMVELSKQRFSSLFKANMGKSPMEYVREIRLTTAARALLVSNKNINDIAYECGYEDANYFIREFKSAFGFTPNQYRKIARE